MWVLMNKNVDESSSFWIPTAPYSTDPAEYDFGVHHITGAGVTATLVSQYNVGEYVPLIATNWDNFDNFKRWTFTIRAGQKFEDGTPITTQIVVSSLKRMAFLLHKKESSAGIFEHVVGIEKLQSLHDQLTGLRIVDNKIEITFTKPIKNLLGLISFGLYGIVHPSDYDDTTGKWKDDKKIIASGQYRLSKWNDDNVILERRDDFLVGYGHPRKFKQIVVTWKRSDYKKADMVFGSSFSEGLDSDYAFDGPVKSGIAYVHLFSWNNPKSVFYKKENRKILRDIFYDQLDAQDFQYTTSFFPLAINGVSEINRKKQEVLGNSEIGGEITMPSSEESVNPLMHRFTETWSSISKTKASGYKINVKFPKKDFQKMISDLDANKSEYTYDLHLMMTNILISEPSDDIRFMFLSKEGVCLPDTDGSVKKLLAEPTIDVQKINQKLWADAIIWPVLNYADGFWAKKNIDISMLNLNLPPIDFAWIGAK